MYCIFDMLHNLSIFLHKMLLKSQFYHLLFIVTFFISHLLKFKYQSRTLEVNLKQHWARETGQNGTGADDGLLLLRVMNLVLSVTLNLSTLSKI